MLNLADIHQQMQNKAVLKTVDALYFEWMYKELDGLDEKPDRIRKWLKYLFPQHGIVNPTSEQFLAAERLFQARVENV